MSRSTRSTANDPVAALPFGSAAVQATVVLPSANTDSDAGVHAGVTAAPELSVAVAAGYAIERSRWPASARTDRSPGSRRTGGSTSAILTWKVAVAMLPAASVEVHVTVVLPIGKKKPDGGTQATLTPGALSDAVGVNVAVVPGRPGAVGLS